MLYISHSIDVAMQSLPVQEEQFEHQPRTRRFFKRWCDVSVPTG